ncbi:MAG: c-type cytochrome [Chitinophagaceae bacterium]|nr:MAG: c-type cytochrome [Chitinophagaceae bacterium]
MTMKKILLVVIISISFIPLLTSFKHNADRGEIALGKMLFSDPILSRDMTISCASCHIPDYAFADTATVSTGVFGRKGKRNSPSAMNVLLRRSLFWDGRVNTLEEQALAPIENPDEMDLSIDSAIARLAKNPTYNALFQQVYNAPPGKKYLSAALAAFERTLETSESPFDEWKFSGDSNAISASVKRGFELFSTKGKCTQCHFGADFTANEFRNIGLFNGTDLNDSGRAVVTQLADDIGRFKTPTLRNIALTAPYMHNGMFRTLDEVLDFYNDTKSIVPNGLYTDSVLSRPLGLTDAEKSDIKAFMLSLTDKRFQTTIQRIKTSAVNISKVHASTGKPGNTGKKTTNTQAMDLTEYVGEY